MELRGVSGSPGDQPRAHDDLLRRLVETVTDYAIFVLDTDGRVVTWNAGAEHLKGFTADEIIGQHFSRFYRDEEVEAGIPDRELAIAAADGHFEDEGWRVRNDGTLFWANVVITALRGADGRLLGFGKVTRDLTERRRGEEALRDSEERFRLLVTSVADYAIFLLEPDGTVASWNKGAERLKGYRADEIIGQHFSRFYTEDDRRTGLPATALRTALEVGRWEHEGWRVRRDGSRFWANAVITALHSSDGRHRGFTKVTRDLTERKRNEDALRGVLDREREAAARLRELDQVKSDLVAVIAHDLRTPVSVVHNLLDALRTDWGTLSEEERLEFVDRATTRLESMAGLVDDVFDLARIEAGQLTADAHTFDVRAVIDDVVAEAADWAPGRRIDVRADRSHLALGDQRRTWQVVTNLVSNAAKFSKPDSVIDVHVDDVGGEVVVAVTDHGIGIPEEEHALLFQRFVRLPSSGAVPGSGVGLFIARSLIEAQGGHMSFESAPGVGSTFRFALPAADLG